MIEISLLHNPSVGESVALFTSIEGGKLLLVKFILIMRLPTRRSVEGNSLHASLEGSSGARVYSATSLGSITSIRDTRRENGSQAQHPVIER